MKRILMISIGLLMLIVGISCATAINLDLQKDTKVIDFDGPVKNPFGGSSGTTKQQGMQNQGNSGQNKVMQYLT